MTSPPEAVRRRVTGAIRGIEADARIRSVEPVAGGCINHGARIATHGGAVYFLKWNAAAPAGLFEAEADGLRALAAATASVEAEAELRVPQALAWEDAGPGPSWLLLEHVQAGPSREWSDERLGAGLARIHGSVAAHGPSPAFGWPRDNWIGSLAQANAQTASWCELWRDRRILPQLERARADGRLHDALLDRLIDAIPAALEGVERPALLHGDLWSGNVFVDTNGVPVLIDPAVYVGDGEADLAMTELFGRFAGAFYDAYADRRPISPEYRAFRRDLYQLYYLLVHVNLFGSSYVPGTRRAAERVVAAIA